MEFWEYLSRWQALPCGATEWIVRAERTSLLCAEPNTFVDHRAAQKRADGLNIAEQTNLATRKASLRR
jgi:hypothetical protein